MRTKHMLIQSEQVETRTWKTRRKGDVSIFDPRIIRQAIPDSLQKLDPRVQVRNPVMFVVEIGSVIATGECIRLLFAQPTPTITRAQLTFETLFVLMISLWLWFTVIFANFAEAIAEGRGKAQADTLAQGPHHHNGLATGRT
jgi:K+-transporting ATPase ATPase B chain